MAPLAPPHFPHPCEYNFDSTAVGKAPEVYMDASDWKYIFPTSDEEIMG